MKTNYVMPSQRTSQTTLQRRPSVDVSASVRVTMRSRFLKTPRKDLLSEEEEAELISKATMQAVNASRSILLAGGTQASAMSTAEAAALSVLLPKTPGLPSMAQKKRFGRKKCKGQAQVIASMALSSVNRSLQNTEELVHQPEDAANFIMMSSSHHIVEDDCQNFSKHKATQQTSPRSTSHTHSLTPRSSKTPTFELSGSAVTSLTGAASSPRSPREGPPLSSSCSLDSVQRIEKCLSPISESVKTDYRQNQSQCSASSEGTCDYFRKREARVEEQKRSHDSSLGSAKPPKLPIALPLPRSKASKLAPDYSFEQPTDQGGGGSELLTLEETAVSRRSSRSSSTNSSHEVDYMINSSDGGSTDNETTGTGHHTAGSATYTTFTRNDMSFDDLMFFGTTSHGPNESASPWLPISDFFSCMHSTMEDDFDDRNSVGPSASKSSRERVGPKSRARFSPSCNSQRAHHR